MLFKLKRHDFLLEKIPIIKNYLYLSWIRHEVHCDVWHDEAWNTEITHGTEAFECKQFPFLCCYQCYCDELLIPSAWRQGKLPVLIMSEGGRNHAGYGRDCLHWRCLICQQDQTNDNSMIKHQIVPSIWVAPKETESRKQEIIYKSGGGALYYLQSHFQFRTLMHSEHLSWMKKMT